MNEKNQRGNLAIFLENVAKNGGCSYNPTTGVINPDKGYMVSVKGAEKIFEGNLQDSIGEYYADYFEKLNSGKYFLGAWVNKGVTYLDLSVNVLNENEAIIQGILNQQKAIWNCGLRAEINLPMKKQSCGTEYQKRTFAVLQAQRIQEHLAWKRRAGYVS